MKKFLFKSTGVFMAVILLLVQTQSLSAKKMETSVPDMDESVFVLDEEALNQELEELNALDQYVSTHEGTTFNELVTSGSDLIANISDEAAPMGMAGPDDPLGIPAFWWGCLLSWVGILIVYLVAEYDRSAQAKKALWGCLISTGVWVVFYALYAALLVESSTLYRLY
jgi:hypothetical protein